MSKIHHRCRCTGQEFTFDEWCARCRALEFVRKCKETHDPRQLTLFEI